MQHTHTDVRVVEYKVCTYYSCYQLKVNVTSRKRRLRFSTILGEVESLATFASAQLNFHRAANAMMQCFIYPSKALTR